ncbi:hypothetical protein QBC47DRAFT_416235 [Echria macrotheca]|uniref:Uncharacterized protein n=1 Tax=Echria macrotheca TaxID=438768 RepID=A0AAJ0B9D7_9PEZI|nr:hypothetical protein QBC47DRAFT_416235 [Echria macrotheca]
MAPIKIAVLDDYQGISIPKFRALDPSKFETSWFPDTLLPYNHPNTPQHVKDELVKRLEPFEIISTMRERTPFPASLISRLPNLKLLLTTSTRNLSLDLAALAERNIPVAGAVDKAHPASGAGSVSTTEHCVALILGAARNLAGDDLSVKTGGWQTVPAVSLRGKVLGIVGLGRLGVAVAKIMVVAFGMKVIAWSENLTQSKADEKARAEGLGEGVFRVVSKEVLFREADVVSVHLVLSERSRGVIGETELGWMKRDAILVNTSRGPLVVEEALLDVLERGGIRAAALDVFEIEPLPRESKWRTTRWGEEGRSRVLLTPHMGYVEEATLEGWYEQQVENVERWARGEALVQSLY